MLPFRQILPMIALCLFALSNSAINANFVAASKQIERGTDNVHHFAAIGQRVIRMRRHDEQNILNDDSNGVGEASSDGMMPTTTNEPETTTMESSTQATTMEVSTDTPTTLTTESSSLDVDLSSSTEKNEEKIDLQEKYSHARFLIAGLFAFMTIIFLILLILTACGVICAKSVEEEVDADG